MYAFRRISESLIGEGRWAGRPATFLRFSRCNLSCPWCDMTRHTKIELDLVKVLEKVKVLKQKSVVLTGGDPSSQPEIGSLIAALKEAGYWVMLETNGLVETPNASLCDYVAVSPKYIYRNRYRNETMVHEADEVRIVAEDRKIVEFCREMRGKIAANDYVVLPLEKDGKMHYRRAYDVWESLNRALTPGEMPWIYGLQIRKVLGLS